MKTRGIVAFGLVVAALAGASACGPDAKQRCADVKAAECPAGQTNLEDGPEYCEARYQGPCSGEWDDYVSCAIQHPHCATTTTCFDNEFKAYSKCECDYEGAGSPWCVF